MKFKYPKLTGFIVAIIMAYAVFSNPLISEFISNLGKLSHLGSFIAGLFYMLGFTSPFSTGFFIDLNLSNIWLPGILGGIGALIGDMIIFNFVKASFKNEFERLRGEKIIKSAGKIMEKIFGKNMQKYILYLFAAILIASPLPDEAGLTILAGLTKIKASAIAVISIIFNTIGILILLSI